MKEDANYKPAHAGLAQYFNEHSQFRRAAWHAKLADTIPPLDLHSAEVVKSLPASQAGAQSIHTDSSTTSTNREVTEAEVHGLCATCHAYPVPESMPRATWRKEVKQGYDFLRRSNVAGDFPSLESVVAYYERRAPERLPQIEQSATSSDSPVKFQTRGTGYMPQLPPSPSVTNANLVNLLGNKTQELLLCETVKMH